MKRMLILLAAWLLPASSALAKEIPVDPEGAYIIVEVRHLENAMLKGTKVPGVVTLARYDADLGDVREQPANAETPAKEAFRITLQGKPAAKTKSGRLYVVKVVPDNWVIEGANGTAFSLGSMMFSVQPKQVIDLGVFTPAVDWVEGEGPKGMAAGLLGAALFGSMKPKETRPIRIDWHERTAADMPVPPALADRMPIPATYSSGHKFGNHLGGLVNRFGGRAARGEATQPAQ